MTDVLSILTAFARAEDGVRALVLFGSRARQDCPADAFSDWDFLLFVDDVSRFARSEEWLFELFDVAVSFVEPTLVGGSERRILLRDGADVDLLFLDADGAAEILRDADVRGMLARGYRAVVDKIGVLGLIGEIEAPASRPPTEEEFLNLANDLAFHVVWAAKKAARGEIWAAKMCADGYMKRLLLQMLEWNARSTRGADFDIWHDGRFLDRWADADAVRALPEAFALYDKGDILRALLRSAELFRALAGEVARAHGFRSPDGALAHAIGYLEGHRGGGA